MDDLSRLIRQGPGGGVGAAILAIGCSVLIVLWRALPVFRGWAQAIQEVRGIGTRAAARLDDLIDDHSRLRADVARLIQLATEPARGPTMPGPADLAAVTEEVKLKLQARPEPPPGQQAAVDIDRIFRTLGTVDAVVAKLYPILAPLLPGNVAAIAAVIFQVIEALAHRGTTPP